MRFRCILLVFFFTFNVVCCTLSFDLFDNNIVSKWCLKRTRNTTDTFIFQTFYVRLTISKSFIFWVINFTIFVCPRVRYQVVRRGRHKNCSTKISFKDENSSDIWTVGCSLFVKCPSDALICSTSILNCNRRLRSPRLRDNTCRKLIIINDWWIIFHTLNFGKIIKTKL